MTYVASFSFYKTDFQKVQLTTQPATYYANCPAMKNKCVHDVVQLVFSRAEKVCLK